MSPLLIISSHVFEMEKAVHASQRFSNIYQLATILFSHFRSNRAKVIKGFTVRVLCPVQRSGSYLDWRSALSLVGVEEQCHSLGLHRVQQPGSHTQSLGEVSHPLCICDPKCNMICINIRLEDNKT